MVYRKNPLILVRPVNTAIEIVYQNQRKICFLSLQNSPNVYTWCEVTILCCIIYLQALILLLGPREASEVLCEPPLGFMCITDTRQLKLVGKIRWKMRVTKLSTPLQSDLWLFSGHISGTLSLWPFFLFNFDPTEPLFSHSFPCSPGQEELGTRSLALHRCNCQWIPGSTVQTALAQMPLYRQFVSQYLYNLITIVVKGLYLDWILIVPGIFSDKTTLMCT